MATQTARINVYQDDSSVAGTPWFQWPMRLHIATYACDVWDAEEFGDSVPHPDSVKACRKLHPDAVLLFLDGGSHNPVAKAAGEVN